MRFKQISCCILLTIVACRFKKINLDWIVTFMDIVFWILFCFILIYLPFVSICCMYVSGLQRETYCFVLFVSLCSSPKVCNWNFSYIYWNSPTICMLAFYHYDNWHIVMIVWLDPFYRITSPFWLLFGQFLLHFKYGNSSQLCIVAYYNMKMEV